MSDEGAAEAFGPNGVAVRDFILGVLDYPWFQNVYRPEPWDHDQQILRVYSWRRAWALLPTTKKESFLAWRRLPDLREHLERADPDTPWAKWYFEATYYAGQLVSLLLKSRYGEAAGKAAVGAEYATAELVLQPAVPDPPHYFLGLMPYWQQGHWPVGVRDDGKLLVF